MEKVLQFLSELAVNNNRVWFDMNKQWYLECREKVLFTTDVLVNEISKFDRTIPVMDAKDCLFRIYRDVRFSEDKRPYKTHFGSFISNGGRKSEGPGYYIHIEPNGSFVGGGIYRPSAPLLKAIREYVSVNGHEFEEIIKDKSFNSALPEIFDDRLKTAPKGYSVDHPYIHLLRYKSFAFSAHIPDASLKDGTFINDTLMKYKYLHKINLLLYDALAT